MSLSGFITLADVQQRLRFGDIGLAGWMILGRSWDLPADRAVQAAFKRGRLPVACDVCLFECSACDTAWSYR